MTNDDRVAAIEAVLREAEAAHAVYERDELGGVYDETWPAWYAGFAVDHGLGDALGRPVDAVTLGEYFERTWQEVQQSGQKPAERWSAWMARRIATEL